MKMGRYVVGNHVRVDIEFVGNVDPTSIVFYMITAKYRIPLTYTFGVNSQLIRDSAGHYHVVIDTTNEPGVWNYRVTTAGPISINESFFTVTLSAVR